MKTPSVLLLAIVLLSSACSRAPENQSSTEHVIIIGVDGMSPDGVQTAETPVMDRLMEEGSYTMHARGVLPTSSSPNWASMITGVGPEQHGVTSNSWRDNEYNFPTSVRGTGSFFPSIFQIITEQNPDMEVGAIYHWGGFANLFDHSFPDYDETRDSEDETTQLAVDYIKEKKPDFLFVHLDHVDHAGHSYGHGTDHYYESVAKADSLIGEIKKATEEAGIAGNTVIIISSDHGGVGKGHGGESLAELEIPWIAYGKGIRKGNKIPYPVNTYDTPATAAYLLGVDIPYAWIGKPVTPAFTSETLPAPEYQSTSFYKNPVIHPKNEAPAPSGGLFLKGSTTVRMENPNSKGEIRYTIDGSTPDQNSTLYSGPFQLTESTIVKAAIFEDRSAISLVEPAYFRILNPESNTGLNYTAYTFDNTPIMLPDFIKEKPVASGTAYEFSLDQAELPQEDNVALVFEGYLEIDQPGEYDFYTASDDGSKLYINDILVVDNDGDHGILEKDGDMELEPGKHKIRVEWFNGGGGKWLGAFYKGPGIPKQFISADKLSKNK